MTDAPMQSTGKDRQTENQAATEENNGCAIDWSWLEGRQIASVQSNLNEIVITFTGGSTLRVQAHTWQGKPWLSFDPWRDPGK